MSIGIFTEYINVSLVPYHYHVILRYLRIQSLHLVDIRSHPILCLCLCYLQVSNELDQKQRRQSGDIIIALIRLQITMFASLSPDIRLYSLAFGPFKRYCVIRNMFLHSVRKAYIQHILKQLQTILINNSAYAVIVRRLKRFCSNRIE